MKTTIYKKLATCFFLTGLAFTLSACGDDGFDGKDGATGPQGVAGVNGSDGTDGIDGKDALTPLQTIILTPSRDYDPSTFNPASLMLGAGIFKLPLELPLTVGVAGTGWASITVSGTRFCYQGDGKNNSDAGSTFEYVGAFELPGECYSASLSDEPLENSSFFEDMNIQAEVHGGGVSSSIRTFTQVEAEIQVRELN